MKPRFTAATTRKTLRRIREQRILAGRPLDLHVVVVGAAEGVARQVAELSS